VTFGVCIRMLRSALANRVSMKEFNGVGGARSASVLVKGLRRGLRRCGLGRKMVYT
jgi:hypothetical protein